MSYFSFPPISILLVPTPSLRILIIPLPRQYPRNFFFLHQTIIANSSEFGCAIQMNWPLWIDVKVIICRALPWKWNNKDSEGWCWNQGHGYGWEEKTRHCQQIEQGVTINITYSTYRIAVVGSAL